LSLSQSNDSPAFLERFITGFTRGRPGPCPKSRECKPQYHVQFLSLHICLSQEAFSLQFWELNIDMNSCYILEAEHHHDWRRVKNVKQLIKQSCLFPGSLYGLLSTTLLTTIPFKATIFKVNGAIPGGIWDVLGKLCSTVTLIYYNSQDVKRSIV
jgi:hypothetical protein